MTFSRLAVPWLLMMLLTGLLVQATPEEIKAEQDLIQAMIDWLRSKGGYFNEKLEMRRADPTDIHSRFGMFANAAIAPKELLLQIPPSCIIDAGMEVEEPRQMDCDTVRNLITEFRLGQQSQYAPYLNYLLAQTTGQLPSAWSDPGKQRLLEVIGNHQGKPILPPTELVDWITEDWHGTCKGSSDPLEEFAALIPVQRGWDDLLIPFFDVMNHRNGNYTNIEAKHVRYGRRVKVTAKREIAAGEEVYNTYNECDTCEGRNQWYGTFEMLRDYGFVEDFPQRWIFNDDLGFLLEQDGNGRLGLMWTRGSPGEEEIEFMREQLQRLVDMGETDFSGERDSRIPQDEWNTICQFREALVVALSTAMEVVKQEGLLDDDEETCGAAGKGECAVDFTMIRYDELDEEPEDDLVYSEQTCGAAWDHGDRGFDFLEVIKSPYQQQDYFIHPRTKDCCFNLEGTTQICASYRPHYHEYGVHFPARFLEKVERVMFIGGGDSMLLHEVLKYPTLEKVVGLELDQKVTRAAFKYFGAQPHWNDPRVEWWYGDATKSLLMLPKDYFGSFDMVLVDLSETVMSLTVTDSGMDILEALTLLVKPDGIMLKNEQYLDAMSAMFDHTLQIYYYDVPVICSQGMVMGSNKIDFLNTPLKEHPLNGEMLLIPPLEEITNHMEHFHDYLHNNTRDNKQCKAKKDIELQLPTSQKASPGILMIVEAEDAALLASAATREPQSTKDVLVKAVEQVTGFQVVSSLAYKLEEGNGLIYIVLKRGYIVARTWPSDAYAALDIHLWSAFDQHDELKYALTDALLSKRSSVSSYRIVAGGMFGADQWKTDEVGRGPRVTQVCEKPVNASATKQESSANETMVLESMALLKDVPDITVAVLCGTSDSLCPMVDLVKKIDNVANVLPLYSCPDLPSSSSYAANTSDVLFACEKQTIQAIVDSLENNKQRIQALLMDESAHDGLGRIVVRILTDRRDRFLAAPGFLAVALCWQQPWRKHVLELLRQNVYGYEPAYRAQVEFDNGVEWNLFHVHDDFFNLLKETSARIEKKTGLVADVRSIRCGLWKQQGNMWLRTPTARIYSPDDYDRKDPLAQWRGQQPVGHQSVFQLEAKHKSMLTTERIQKGLKETLSTLTRYNGDFTPFVDGIGGIGSVICGHWPEGSILALWDGHVHVDVNLFTYTESTKFSQAFLTMLEQKTSVLQRTLHDDFPRGHHRVVNFHYDIEPSRSRPFWLEYVPPKRVVEEDEDDEEDEEEDETGLVSMEETDEDEDDLEDEEDDSDDDEEDSDDEEDGAQHTPLIFHS